MRDLSSFLPDDTATRKAGAALAPFLRTGDVIALYGGLGAGKTTLSRGLISALMGTPTEVPSPTYTLLQTYNAPNFPLYHFDLYRLKTPDELIELGWDDTQNGVALIEWPERAGDALPVWRLDIRLESSEDGRKLRLEAHGEDWQTRLDGFRFDDTTG